MRKKFAKTANLRFISDDNMRARAKLRFACQSCHLAKAKDVDARSKRQGEKVNHAVSSMNADDQNVFLGIDKTKKERQQNIEERNFTKVKSCGFLMKLKQ